MIFVGGIHGVGKTYLCTQLSQEHQLLHYSASTIISREKNECFTRDKRISRISTNQDFLKIGLNKLGIANKDFLLDGHFCLIDKDRSIVKIPEATFFSLSPKAIVTVTNSIDKVISNLKSRDDQDYDAQFLNDFQKEEINYSREIASKLDVPFYIYNPLKPTQEIFDFINNVLMENKIDKFILKGRTC
ncbi:ATP-binding protein [Priestia endophytica]|uniref:ATP-binding protein n=1 Tax=Priestia endophytica TaxID=135735 RepID=UPI00227EBC09|nr:ATP-binding protein [Priestia endophytica]MCY8233465.1 ATP-binding protein [Priestia endophytica]